jgi:hypothetical protein
MKRYLMDIVGRYSRPRRAGLRFRANALFIIMMERKETETHGKERRTDMEHVRPVLRTNLGREHFQTQTRGREKLSQKSAGQGKVSMRGLFRLPLSLENLEKLISMAMGDGNLLSTT